MENSSLTTFIRNLLHLARNTQTSTVMAGTAYTYIYFLTNFKYSFVMLKSILHLSLLLPLES